MKLQQIAQSSYFTFRAASLSPFFLAFIALFLLSILNVPADQVTHDLQRSYYFSNGDIAFKKIILAGIPFSDDRITKVERGVLKVDTVVNQQSVIWQCEEPIKKVKVAPDKKKIAVVHGCFPEKVPSPSLVILDHEGDVLKEVTPQDKNKGVMDFAWHSDSNRFAYVIGEPLIEQEVFNYTRGGVYVSSLEDKDSEYIFPLGFEVMWSTSEDALYIYDECFIGEIVYQYIPSSRNVVYATCRDFFFSPDRKHYYSKPREAFAIFNAYKIDSEDFSEDGQFIIRFDSLFFPQAVSKQDRNPEHAKMAYRLYPLFWVDNERIAVRSPMSVKGPQTAYLLNIRTMQLSKTDGIILEKGHRENEVLVLTESGYQLVNADSFTPASIDELPRNPAFEPK